MAEFLSVVVRRNVCCVRISFFIQSVASSTLFIFFESYVIIYICIVPVCFTWRSKMNKFEYFAHHFWFVNFARSSLCEIVPPFAQSFDHRRIVTAIEIKERKKKTIEFCLLFLCWRIIALPVCYHVLVDLKQRTSETSRILVVISLSFGVGFWLLFGLRFEPLIYLVHRCAAYGNRLNVYVVESAETKFQKEAIPLFSWLVIVEHKTRLFRAKLKIYYTRIDILYSKGE